MKRKLTFLISAAVMLLTMMATTGEMWGQTRDTKTEGFETATAATTYNSTATVSTNQSDCGIGWSIYYGNVSTTQAITGSKSCLIRYYTADAVLGYAKTTTGIQGLSNITFNAKVTNTGNKMGVWYSTDGNTWTALATDVTLTTSSASKSYDIPNSSSSTTYYVKIGLTTGSSTNKKDLIFDDVVFTYSTGGSDLEDSDLTLTGAPVALNFDLYNNSSAQVINYTTSSTGAVTVSTSDYVTTSVNTTNKTITVTPTAVTPSAQTITVSQAADASYNAGSATFTVTITNTPPAFTVTLGDDSSTLTETSSGAGVTLPTRETLNGYNFAGWSETNVATETTTAPTIIPAGEYHPTANITLYPVYSKTIGGGGSQNASASVTIADYAFANNWNNGTAYQPLTMNTYISIGGEISGNNFKYYTSDNSWRFYTDGSFTISTSNNATLSSVTLTFSGGLSYNSSAITSGTAFDVTGTSASISCTANAKITAISVSYTIPGSGTTYYWSSPVAATVETPAIVVAENPFLFSTTATITCATEGAAIKYSYDNENWNDYSAPLTITETKTIYAKAIKDNNQSSVASVTATKNLAVPTVTIDATGITNTNVFTSTTAGNLSATVTYNEEAIEGAVVTWSGNADAVATIDASTGAVTLVAAGSVTFTATYAGNGDYSEKTATYQMTVTNTDPNAPGTQSNPYTVAQARAAIDAGTGLTFVYATGIISQVDSYNSTYNSITYWISSDGTTTSDQLEVYSGKGLNNTNFSSIDDVKVGATVVVYGTLKKYGDVYEFDKNNYLTSYTAPVITVEAPTFSPVAGTYDEAQSVTLSCITDDATIYYTLNGNDPTNASTQYTTAINVASTTTIKAIAYVGDDYSTVATATYTIVSLNNISDITEVGTAYSVKGTVVATNSKGFVMGDGTGYIYYYKNGDTGKSVGDLVKVSGTTGTYGQIIQFTNSATVTEAATSNYNNTPAATVITEVPDYSTSYHLSTYLEFEGTLTKSGSNYLITLGESQIQISYPTTAQSTALTAFDGKTVHVKGYFTGINSSSKFTVMLESAEEVIITTPSVTITDATVNVTAESGNGTINVTYLNIEPDDINPEAQFFASDGETSATYDWISVEFNNENNAVYTVEANDGEARTAYFKVYEQSEGIYSNLITVNQAAPVAPVNPHVTWDLSTDQTATATTTEMTWTSDYATMAVVKGNASTNTNNYYPGTPNQSYTSTRFYKNSELTIAPVAGHAITSVVFTATTENYATAFEGSTWTNATASASSTTVTATPTNGSNNIVATIGGTCGFTAVTVYYTDAPIVETVATPTFTPEAGEYNAAQNVTIACTTNGATIHYTTNGDTPTEESTEYTAAIPVSTTTTIKAIAVKDGMNNSAVATATYTINTTPTPSQDNWVLADLADLTSSDVFVIVGNNGNTYAMSNDNGTNNPPTASAVTIANNKLSAAPDNNLKWNISGNANDGYIFYPNGSTTTWLYCTDANNGVRVGTNVNKLFTVDNGYLMNTATSRYVGIYNSSDWRCYTSTGGNIAGQTFAFYKKVSTEPSITINPGPYNMNCDGGHAVLEVSCSNMAQNPKLEVVFYESDGTTAAAYNHDWITATIDNDGNLDGTIQLNNSNEARSAYFKIKGVGNDNSEVYSDLVTINQAAYSLSIVFETDELNIEVGGESDRKISFDYSGLGSSPTFEVRRYASDGTTSATYDWLTTSINKNKVNIIVSSNTGAARHAYFKVYGAGNNTNTESNLVTINQAEYVALTYTVTYDANGGTGTMTDPNSPYTENAEVTLLENTFTAPEGKIWDSWSVKDANQETITVNNGKFNMPASNVTVSAQWVDNPVTPTYEWELTELADLTASDVFVIVGNNGNTYAMSNDNGTNNPPTASAVTIANNKLSAAPADNLKWNISGNATDGYTFYPNGTTETWLYCTNTNNGVRVGTNDNKLFTVDNGYLMNTATSRYVGIYNSSDWRCYTSTDGNIANQTFAFYKRVPTSAPTDTYLVNFNLDDGIFVPNNDFPQDVVEKEAGTYHLPSATKEGFDFTGWSDGNTTYEADAEYTVSADVDFTAQWTESTSTTGTIAFGSAQGSTPINSTSVTGYDSLDNEWTITTEFSGETSFTQNASYSQIGASSKPASSITFTMTLPQQKIISAFEAKFGGFSNTAGDITLKVGDVTVGTGSLNATNDVIVNATNTTETGTVLTVTVTNIAKGVKCYYISYTLSPAQAVPTINATSGSNLAYDATSGSIIYEIENYEEGTMTAASEADWISNIEVDEDDNMGEVTFDVTPNTSNESRSATVTLTFTYDTDKTATANVTVTQNGQPGQPSITVDPDSAVVVSDGGAPEFTITYASIAIEDDDDFDVQFYESNGTQTISKPDWINSATISGNTTDGFTLTVTVDPNTSAERAAYLKVYALDGDDIIYSNLITISQNEYIPPATYTLVTNINQVVSGKHYIIASSAEDGPAYAMGAQNSNNRAGVAVTVSEANITQTGGVYEFVINGPNDGKYTIYDKINSGYLYAASSGSNYLKTETELDNNGRWSINVANSGVATIIATGTNTRNNMRYNSSSTIFSCYSSGQYDVYLYVKDDDIELEYYGDPVTLAANAFDFTHNTYSVGGTMTITGAPVANDPSSLIIQDGAQLIHESSINATVQNDVTAAPSWTSNVGGGWYFIASPIDGAVITESILVEPFDLYKYNEPAAMWYAYNGDGDPFTTMERGIGYLHASADDQILAFAGTMIGTETEITKPLSYECTYGDLIGYNLMGNPYTRVLEYGDMKIGGVNVTSFLSLNDAGTEYVTCNLQDNDRIRPCQGFFIQATGAGQNLVFKPAKKDKSEIGLISIKAGNEEFMDKAYIQIGGGNTLRKMAFSDNSMVYVMDGDDDYSAMTIYELANPIPVHFVAAEPGTYTITVNAKNIDLDYMHLVDEFTNEHIDLLSEPTYTFTSAEGDKPGRFTIVFGIDNVEENLVNDVFAYQYEDELVVDGNGTLQIFDVLGRFVGSHEVHGSERISLSSFNTGVYVLRMVGENVKTQKIVVR